MTFKLLTVGNPKIAKSLKFGYLTALLHLAPADLSGYEVCPKATAGCRAACLNTAGRGGMMAGVSRLTHEMVAAGVHNTIQKARIRRTRWYFTDRSSFMEALCLDGAKLVKLAAKMGVKLAIRLNGTSDIPWERVRLDPYTANIMARFPEVQFYDYTKRVNRTGLPSNYHLTLSLAEDNDRDAHKALQSGLNVAAVFHKVPPAFALPEPVGFGRLVVPVIDGDEHDLRFLDPRGVIVGLKAKGNAKTDRTGFVR
jgi:hypothetical protein